ncbi:MAG: hypothetical protein BGO55_08745 [Sphingobacteriales bacterium 50-39]|nr:hypothetical protein [Sphingobacteriales bacterium]OJW59350.1 MAG: hypothetical protein BGO55_08745 [Sphingobacteriales bacterium 50-39]
MDAKFFVGVIFAAVLVAFLMVSFFKKNDLSHSQYNTLHFLTALCGGCAGWFISGSALFNLSTTIGQTGTLAVSGTAGAALFFTVWFGYPKRDPPPPPDGLSFSVAPGTTFEAMANIIVETGKKFVQFENFSAAQLKAVLTEREVHATGVGDALAKLKYLNPSLPGYTVKVKGDLFTLKAK